MVVTELTDAELLDRARQGDEAAFTALYRRHHPAVHRLATSYRHGGEADDLVDATFAEVVAHLRRRSGPTEAFRAYLFATVHGRAVAEGEPDEPGSAGAKADAGAGADAGAKADAGAGAGAGEPGGSDLPAPGVPASTIEIATPTVMDADGMPDPVAPADPSASPEPRVEVIPPGSTGPVPPVPQVPPQTAGAVAAPAGFAGFANPGVVSPGGAAPAGAIGGAAAGVAAATTAAGAGQGTGSPEGAEWPAVPEPVAAVAHLPALGGADRVMITRAFESLPDRWQVPLWHTVVLGGDAASLGRALGVTTSVAAPIARYAGGKLRQAYLQAHLDAAPRPACEPHRARLAAHRRGALDPEATDGVREHLSRCDSCRDLIAALDTVEELLARSVVPFFPTAAGRPGVPRPMGVSGQLAVVDVPGDTPSPDGGRRRSDAYAGSPTAPAPPSSVGAGDDERDGGQRSGGLGPRLGGAAAATVLVASLAVVGTAMTRDGGEPGSRDPAAGEPLSPGDEGDIADRESGDADRRPEEGDEDDSSPTTVPDHERADDDDEDEDDDPAEARRPASATATGSRADGRSPGTSAPATESPSTDRPTTTTTTPTTEPPPDPDPELASWQVGWSAGSATGGTLTATVTGPGGSGPVETAPVQLTIELSGGAHPGSLDSRCQAAGQTVTCTVPAPTAGSSTSVSVGVSVDGSGESATVSARQAGASLGAHQVALTVEAPEAAGAEP